MGIEDLIRHLGDAVSWMNLVFHYSQTTQGQNAIRELLMNGFHAPIVNAITDPVKKLTLDEAAIAHQAREFRREVGELTYPLTYRGENDHFGAVLSIQNAGSRAAIESIRRKMSEEYRELMTDLGYMPVVFEPNKRTSVITISGNYAYAILKDEQGVHKFGYDPENFGEITAGKLQEAHISVLVRPLNPNQVQQEASARIVWRANVVRSYNITKHRPINLYGPIYDSMWQEVLRKK